MIPATFPQDQALPDTFSLCHLDSITLSFGLNIAADTQYFHSTI